MGMLLQVARARLGDEFDGRLTGMIDKSITVAMQALDNPDISAREAAIVLAIAYDKRALHRGQATSRVERVNLGELRALSSLRSSMPNPFPIQDEGQPHPLTIQQVREQGRLIRSYSAGQGQARGRGGANLASLPDLDDPPPDVYEK